MAEERGNIPDDKSTTTDENSEKSTLTTTLTTTSNNENPSSSGHSHEMINSNESDVYQSTYRSESPTTLSPNESDLMWSSLSCPKKDTRISDNSSTSEDRHEIKKAVNAHPDCEPSTSSALRKIPHTRIRFGVSHELIPTVKERIERHMLEMDKTLPSTSSHETLSYEHIYEEIDEKVDTDVERKNIQTGSRYAIFLSVYNKLKEEEKFKRIDTDMGDWHEDENDDRVRNNLTREDQEEYQDLDERQFMPYAFEVQDHQEDRRESMQNSIWKRICALCCCCCYLGCREETTELYV